MFRVNGVQDFAHAGVAGNLPDAEELLQVAFSAAGVEGRQKRIPQRNPGLKTVIGNLLETGPHRAAQTIGGQMTARLQTSRKSAMSDTIKGALVGLLLGALGSLGLCIWVFTEDLLFRDGERRAIATPHF